jgi:hypothetical protein
MDLANALALSTGQKIGMQPSYTSSSVPSLSLSLPQSRRCIDRNRGGATAIEHSTEVRSRGVVSTEFAAQLCEP